MIRFFLSLFIATLLVGCFEPSPGKTDGASDPEAKAIGDPQAITLAQKVIDASGGKNNWDKVPYLSFDYFGRRYWFWDKINDRYRVESESRKLRAAGKLDGSETHVWLNNQITNDPDSIAKYKDFAYKAWVNDTYWLIFPFKLLDSGVVIKYAGPCIADSNSAATCLELTFQEVGVTPDNKYIAYVDTINNQIIWWDYFVKTTDSLPSVSNPWTDYRDYGNIKISGGRGDDTLKEIKLHTKLSDEIFTDVSRSYKDILY